MARLPYPHRESMPPESADLLSRFPRQSITEMFAHAPTLLRPFLQMAQAQFTALELTARQRELVILAVAGLVECEYEYAQHVPISEAAGIEPDLRERVREGDIAVLDDPVEHALITLATAITRAPTVPDEVFEAARAHLSPRQIVETIQLVTFYWGIGRISTVLQLEIDHPDSLEPLTRISDLPAGRAPDPPAGRALDPLAGRAPDPPAEQGRPPSLSDDQVAELFAATDRGDLDAVTAHFHDDVEVRFGNHSPVHGPAAYATLYRRFTAHFDGLRHEIDRIWRADRGVVVVEMTVHYTRRDGTTVGIPCCNVLEVREGRIRTYSVYLDVTPALATAG